MTGEVHESANPVIAVPAAAVNLQPTAPAPTAVTAFVAPLNSGPANVAVQVEDYAGFEAVFGTGNGDDAPMALAVRQFFDNGGNLAYVVRSADADAGARAFRSMHQGIYALEEVELFNLLCMPGVADGGVLSLAEAYCRDRGALLLADAPLRAETPEQVLASISGSWPRSSHIALFHPWVYVHGADGKRHLAPPSGSIAGMLARNDSARGVWKAPAGRQAHLEGVRALHVDIDEAQAKRLADNGVNSLRMASSLGAVCWSARTLHPSDRPMPELAQIPVRRMANFLEDSLVPALEWTRFERNDPALWMRVAAQAEEFMHGLFTAGAFQGESESQAYFVRCGTDTIRSEDINQGRIGMDLGFAPQQPGQFVRVRVHCLAEAR